MARTRIAARALRLAPWRAGAATAIVAVCLALASALAIGTGCTSATVFERQAAWPHPKTGAVVSEHPLATQAGLAILDRGGNAADAAVATALVLAVVYPEAGNLGGGGFALWVPHVGASQSFDFRETAPRAARAEVFLDASGKPVAARSLRGPFAVGVPGSPLGLYELHRACGSGRFSLRDLAERAIELARDGFEVDAWLARDLAQPDVKKLFNATAAELFFPGGHPLRAGDRLVQPELARTLEDFAREGPAGFYQGRVAEALVAELERERVPDPESGGAIGDGTGRGWLTREDLTGYKVLRRKPLEGWFRGMQIVTMPPPSSGGLVLLQTLGILEGLPLDTERAAAVAAHALESQKGVRASSDTPGLSERMVHWWIEALRAAFADRAEHMGDPDFVKVPVDELLAPRWIAERRVGIGESADANVRPWRAPAREGTNTTHLSVLDAQGNAVSLTTTLNTTFGSGILVRGAGFLLNDEIDDFALQPGSPNVFGLVGGSANAIQPGKRPLSSMTPTVVRDGGHANVMVLGSPGGPRIISAVAQVLLRTLVLDEPLAEAIAAPRLHQQWSPIETIFEPEFDAEIVGALENRRGHKVVRSKEHFASVQAIRLSAPGEMPEAVSDPRRGGVGGVQGQTLPARAAPPTSGGGSGP